MPELEEGDSTEVIQRNIVTLINAGYSRNEAISIALEYAGKPTGPRNRRA